MATVAWLGYDPPDTDDISVFEAGFEDRANEAAPDLAEFYRGINASTSTERACTCPRSGTPTGR